MIQRALFSTLLAAMILPVSGCGGSGDSAPQPKGPTAIRTKPAEVAKASPTVPAPPVEEVDGSEWRVSTSDDDPGFAEVAGMTFPKPSLWTWQQPSMRFRTLQYEVPGTGDQGGATLVFSVFNGTDGGPTNLNIDRWAGQFRSEDGSEVVPILGVMEGDDFNVQTVETAGSYQAMGAPAPRTGQRQLGAIVEAPGRRIFIRVVGPDKTVEQARAEFEKMLTGAFIGSPG